jgi:CheY-like chemotaxis protein
VLVVAPPSTSRDLLREYLDQLSAAHCVASAADAIERVRAAGRAGVCYDHVVVDVEPSGLGVHELVGQLRLLPATRNARVVALSSLAPWHAIDLPSLGAHVRLDKPVYPRALERALLCAEPAAAPTPLTLPDIARSGVRVLLAEDNLVNQIVAQAMLAPWGCTVEIAGNGEIAVEAHLKQPFDVVLMDVQMPEMDGLQATRRIRSLERAGRLPQRPIIAMTANAYDSDREACLAAGMDDFIPKPMLQPQLSEVLGRWLSATAARHAEIC